LPRKPAHVSDFFKGAAKAVSNRKSLTDRARAEEEKEARQQARAEARRARELRRAFPAYFRSVEPFVKALESLPPDADGNEFFARVDLNENGRDWSTLIEGREMTIWLLYTKPAAPNAAATNGPVSYGLAMPEKGKDLQDGPYIDLAISDLPVLMVEGKPTEGGGMKLESLRYFESYTYARGSRMSARSAPGSRKRRRTASAISPRRSRRRRRSPRRAKSLRYRARCALRNGPP
jgi:hypothetical protein